MVTAINEKYDYFVSCVKRTSNFICVLCSFYFSKNLNYVKCEENNIKHQYEAKDWLISP